MNRELSGQQGVHILNCPGDTIMHYNSYTNIDDDTIQYTHKTGFLRVYCSDCYIDIILPEICAFIIGFSCTVWIKTTSLAYSLADGVLADAILIFPRPPLPPTFIRKVRGPPKKYGN